MLNSDYYYICLLPRSGWKLHRKGCNKIQHEEKAFLGSFYAYQQALTFAQYRYDDVSLCPECSGARQLSKAPIKTVTVKQNVSQEITLADTRSCTVPPAIPRSRPVPVKEYRKPNTGRYPACPVKRKGRVNHVPVKHFPDNV